MKTEFETKQQTEFKHGEEKLPGTLIAVLLLGIAMVVSWFGAYGLFLSR